MSEVELLKNRLKTLGERAPAAVIEATKKRLAEIEAPEPITLAEAFGLPAAAPAIRNPLPLYDLHDHKAKFWFRGFTLEQVIEAAMWSAWDDKLELRAATR